MLERPSMEYNEGYPYLNGKPKSLFDEVHDIFKDLSWFSTFPLYLAMLIFSWILLIYQTPEVLDWGGAGGQGGIYITLVPWPMGFYITGISFQIWFIGIVATVTLVIFYGLYDLYKESKMPNFGPSSKRVSDLDLTARFFFASMFFVYGYYIMLDMLGINPVVPDFGSMPIGQMIFGIVNATINEELISRVMLIGIPLMIMHTWNIGPRIAESKGGNDIKTKIKLLMGGDIPINYATIILIILSSVIFAAAHVIGSWDMYKFLPTLVSGMMLGYLYVKRGLHTSILFHFSTNFIFFSAQLWQGDMTILIITGVTLLLWMIVGGYHMLMILYSIAKYFDEVLSASGPSNRRY